MNIFSKKFSSIRKGCCSNHASSASLTFQIDDGSRRQEFGDGHFLNDRLRLLEGVLLLLLQLLLDLLLYGLFLLQLSLDESGLLGRLVVTRPAPEEVANG